MIYKEGNKFCIECIHASSSIKSDLDTVEITYKPSYDKPNCHYCEHCYDNIEKDEKQ